jgi:DNA-binding SARP family transcriptional activator
MFQLNVLGSLSLLSDGPPMPPGALQKRRLGILAVLAIAAGRGMSRDRLQAYLWPESDSAKARHALDQLVYATRRAMDADPFISEGRDLRLNSAVITTDVAKFEDAIQAARLEDAVNAYGGRLLYGIQIAESRDLESWIDSKASQLEQSYQKALETLACRAASAGDKESAVSWRR